MRSLAGREGLSSNAAPPEQLARRPVLSLVEPRSPSFDARAAWRDGGGVAYREIAHKAARIGFPSALALGAAGSVGSS